jgi:hypothetical protein
MREVSQLPNNKKPMMLIDLFKSVADTLPDSRSAQGGNDDVEFTGENLPDVPKTMMCEGISVFSRQFYRGNGTVDNVRVVLDRKSATALGLWILACNLQRKHDDYSLVLSAPTTDVKKIVCGVKAMRQRGVNIVSARVVWSPGAHDEVKAETDLWPYLNQKANMGLVNDEDEWADELSNRKILKGFGALGASCMMATFFLDFGLESSTNNYTYIKDNNQSWLVDEHSCEARVEVSEAWTGRYLFKQPTIQ